MSITLKHTQGTVFITQRENNNKLITVEPTQNIFIPVQSCETDYPMSLIELILKIKGLDYLCDEICRDIDPNYVQRDLEYDLKAYLPEDYFQNKRILDFGCGSGSSTMILSRMFPNSEIIGVELDSKHLEIAQARLDFYGYRNVKFITSPSGNELPSGIGEFDLVIMSAVYEHLLPNERKSVMPLVWSVIKLEGCLFLNMTPHRWFPIEHHTTGLPLLNYLPKALALPTARNFTNRIDKTEPWEILLRRGIRGGTENEILNILSKSSEFKPQLLEPTQKNNKDRIDLWFSQLNHTNRIFLKKSLKGILKTLRATTGMTLVPNLSLLIKKQK